LNHPCPLRLRSRESRCAGGCRPSAGGEGVGRSFHLCSVNRVYSNPQAYEQGRGLHTSPTHYFAGQMPGWLCVLRVSVHAWWHESHLFRMVVCLRLLGHGCRTLSYGLITGSFCCFSRPCQRATHLCLGADVLKSSERFGLFHSKCYMSRCRLREVVIYILGHDQYAFGLAESANQNGYGFTQCLARSPGTCVKP